MKSKPIYPYLSFSDYIISQVSLKYNVFFADRAKTQPKLLKNTQNTLKPVNTCRDVESHF